MSEVTVTSEEKMYELSLTAGEVAIVASATKAFAESFLDFSKKVAESDEGAKHEDSMDEMILELESFRTRVDKLMNRMVRDVLVKKLMDGEIEININGEDCGHEECK